MGMMEEEMEGEYDTKHEEDRLLKLLANYLPGRGDIQQKTVLGEEQPPIASVLENLTLLYPELTEGTLLDDKVEQLPEGARKRYGLDKEEDISATDKVILSFLYRYEERLISVEGQSREEFKEILTAVVRKSKNDEENGGKLSGYFSGEE